MYKQRIELLLKSAIDVIADLTDSVIADLTVSVIADSIRNLCDVRMLNQVQHDAGDAAWRSFVRTDVIRLRG